MTDITSSTGNSDELSIDSTIVELIASYSRMLPAGVNVEGQSIRHISEAELTRFPASAAAVHSRQLEYAAGRVAARTALSRLGVTSDTLPTNPDRTPAWPEGICGSITHDDEVAIAAIASHREMRSLGIDLERPRTLDSAVTKQIASAKEIEAWSEFVNDRQSWSIQLFSLKEALFKAVFPLSGEYFDFQDVEILPSHTEFRGRFKGDHRNLSNLIDRARGGSEKIAGRSASAFWLQD